MKKLTVYVHGKVGNAAEAEHYIPLFPECEVIGFDYRAENPWEAKAEFPAFFDEQKKHFDEITLIANSIGAFFSMSSLDEKQIKRAMFISPIVNMERLIRNMMTWANVSEADLRERGEIATSFGETLSWKYLCYVRENPLKWRVPTAILYGERDNLTSFPTISAFAEKTGASLTVMQGGEHWFHTDEQTAFLDNWITDVKQGKA